MMASLGSALERLGWGPASLPSRVYPKPTLISHPEPHIGSRARTGNKLSYLPPGTQSCGRRCYQVNRLNMSFILPGASLVAQW